MEHIFVTIPAICYPHLTSLNISNICGRYRNPVNQKLHSTCVLVFVTCVLTLDTESKSE